MTKERRERAMQEAQITDVAKVRHAGLERKLMHNPLAPLGKIGYLVRHSDTVLVQHDAAHGIDSPLGG